MVKYIKGQKFYYYLVAQDSFDLDQSKTKYKKEYLYQDYPLNSLFDKLVICYTTALKSDDSDNNQNKPSSYMRRRRGKNNKNNLNRLFTVFNSYVEFAHYMIKFKFVDRNFYEIIHANFQKPKFDIEIEDPNVQMQDVLDEVINGIFIVMTEVKVQLDPTRDILLYSSHGLAKQSCHIVIDNWCHGDNVQARAFYDRVIKHVSPNLVKYVDNSVYSTVQQFRIVGNQKTGSERPKVLNEKWIWRNLGKEYEFTHEYIETPDNGRHKLMLQLSESLITNTSYCKILPDFITVNVKINSSGLHIESNDSSTQNKMFNNTNNNDLEVTPEMGKAALLLMATLAGVRPNDRRFPYVYKSVRNGIVLLNRVRPSMCRICKRIHENENPFLFIVGPEQTVYFNCRRCDPKQKLLIGKLKPLTNSPPSSPSSISTTSTTNSHPQSINNTQTQHMSTLQDIASQTLPKYQKQKYVVVDKKYRKLFSQRFLDSTT